MADERGAHLRARGNPGYAELGAREGLGAFPLGPLPMGSAETLPGYHSEDYDDGG